LKWIRNLPFATIAFIGISVVVYRFGLLSWVEPRSIERLFLHPLIYDNDAHILGNMAFGILVVGALIESWMTRLKRTVRYGVLAYSYVVSLIVAAIWWVQKGFIPIGSSGVILAGLAIVMWYYRIFHDRLDLKGWNALGPVGLGFAFAFLAQIVLRGFLDPSEFGSVQLHVVVFFLSFAIFYGADIVLKQEWKAKLLQVD
jgi:hypothetical protein